MTVLAFDIGGTHLRGAVVDGQRIVTREDVATPDAGPAIVDALKALAARLARQAGDAEAVGLAVAGVLDVTRGVLCASPNLNVSTDLPIVGPLQAALGLPVRLVNDVNAAALGEALVSGTDDLAALFVGTGVGTGFVSGGRLVAGHRGMAGEGGHAVWRPGGRPCPLGCRGCFESYLGGESLARQGRQAGVGPTTADVLAAARAGDERARPIVDAALEAFAGLVQVSLTFFDPERIVLGGGVAAAWPELRSEARRAVASHPFAAGRAELAIEPARLGGDAGLLGAARHVVQALGRG